MSCSRVTCCVPILVTGNEIRPATGRVEGHHARGDMRILDFRIPFHEVTKIGRLLLEAQVSYNSIGQRGEVVLRNVLDLEEMPIICVRSARWVLFSIIVNLAGPMEKEPFFDGFPTYFATTAVVIVDQLLLDQEAVWFFARSMEIVGDMDLIHTTLATACIAAAVALPGMQVALTRNNLT